MTGIGPRAGSEADSTPQQATVDLADAATAAHSLAETARQAGRDEADRDIAAALLAANEAYRAPGEAAQEQAAYGELGRAHFGDPRPGDYPGREAEREAEAG